GLDEVAHQVYLSVHERGTEAAAATAILMIRRAVNGHDEGPVSFRADRPFLFLVRDTGTGTVLFLGRLTKPSSAAPAATRCRPPGPPGSASPPLGEAPLPRRRSEAMARGCHG